MLQIYGSPVSSPTNKVLYVANYLNIPYEFHALSLAAGDQQKSEFLKINPYGKVPAIDDEGFTLAESNAIVRYLAAKKQSPIYPQDLKERARIDQWMDYASLHVMTALSRIMYNTYFYKLRGEPKDERSLQDGRKFISAYLPVLEKQLSNSRYIASNTLSLADIVMLAALDVVEVTEVSLISYPHLSTWRKKLMQEAFYQKCHTSYQASFDNLMKKVFA